MWHRLGQAMKRCGATNGPQGAPVAPTVSVSGPLRRVRSGVPRTIESQLPVAVYVTNGYICIEHEDGESVLLRPGQLPQVVRWLEEFAGKRRA